MSYLFERFGAFVLSNKNRCQDVCKLYNTFVKTLSSKEQEFVYNEFPLFIMTGQAYLNASSELWPYLLGRKC